jgi:hypothetical protein
VVSRLSLASSSTLPTSLHAHADLNLATNVTLQPPTCQTPLLYVGRRRHPIGHQGLQVQANQGDRDYYCQRELQIYTKLRQNQVGIGDADMKLSLFDFGVIV